MAKLNDKQKRFAKEYNVDLNATQAAIRAGYSEKTARSIGQRLLTNVDIQAAIQKGKKALEQKTEITQERVLRELANVAFANATNYAKVAVIRGETVVGIVQTENLTPEQKAAVSCIKQTQNGIEVKLNNKIRALELLGKHLGMFADADNDNDEDDGIKLEVDYGDG